ncbi:MAG: competence protein TfoX [Betaproteobacteria bacterium]|nr:competence protein TfoX [Betaproteobacteria bacterium]
MEHVRDLLAPLGHVRSKPMFGGYGLYVNDVFVAIVAVVTLWFRVDDGNRPDYERAGSRPFRPWADRDTEMPYREVPGEVFDDREAMVAWGGKALAAAERSAAGRRSGKRKHSG